MGFDGAETHGAQLAKSPKELVAFLQPLAEAGVDIFHSSTRRFYETEFPNSGLNLAGWTKKITGKPVISVGSVGLEADFVSNLLTGEVPNPKRCAKPEPLRPRFVRQWMMLVRTNQCYQDYDRAGRKTLGQ